MSARCATCKHWDVKSYAAGNIKSWEFCSEGRDVGECLAAAVDERHLKKPYMMAAICEGEGIYGQLITDAGFGCILHEPA